MNGRKIVGAQTLETFKAAVDQAMGGAAPTTTNDGAAALQGPIEKVNIARSQIRGPLDAPVTIVEFSDFQCPFCGRAVPTLQQLEKEYPGGVRWVFKNFPLEFHPDSLLAHKAALAAGEQGKFWEMHDLIFTNQGAIKRDDLLQKAMQLGLDQQRFLSDLDSNKFQTIIEADKEEGARLGVTGTPTFFINGRRMVGAWPLAEYKKLVEAELKDGGEKRTATAPAKPPIAPAKDKSRPANPPIKLSFASKGPETAPIVITWYCDLESPLSPQAAQVALQLLDIYPGKVRLVFRNLPMDFHAHAALAHQAMLAAGAQGKFWQMQQLILADQHKLARVDLIAHAKTLGLDQAKFVSALDGHLYQPAIDDDAADAQRHGVYGVPVFFVNQRRMDGVQPLAIFKEVINAELAKAQIAAAGR